MRMLEGEAVRFLVAGAINTAVTYLIYLLLLPYLGYSLAYTVTYCLGIVLGYALGVRFTFRVRPRMRSAVLFPLVYAVQYVTGLLLLFVCVRVFGIAEWGAILVAIVLTLPVTFLASRLALKHDKNSTEPRFPERSQ